MSKRSVKKLKREIDALKAHVYVIEDWVSRTCSWLSAMEYLLVENDRIDQEEFNKLRIGGYGYFDQQIAESRDEITKSLGSGIDS